MTAVLLRGPFFLRISFGLVFVGLLFWLPVEDTSTAPSQVFGGLLAFLFSIRFYAGRENAGWSRFRMAGLGFAAGLAASLVSGLLLVFKTGLHSHSAPDFTLGDIIMLLKGAPFLALGGALVGFGLHPLISRT